jgi:diguanylate cyclase (GGDEF)-like protein
MEAAVAVFLHRLILGSADVASARGWLAVSVAVGTAAAVSALAVPAALSIVERAGKFAQMARVVGLAVIAGLTNVGLGLLTVVVLIERPLALTLLAVLAGLAFLGFRGYTSLRDKNESLSLLHEFTHRVGSSLEGGRTVATLLEQSLVLLRAELAELTLISRPYDGSAIVTSLRHGESHPTVRCVQLDADGLEQRTLGRELPLLLPRGERDPGLSRALADRAVRDAVIVPLGHERGVAGTLLLGGRLGEVARFARDDVRLCETVANHAGVLLENGRLVERLRQEIADREHQASHDALTGLPNRTRFAQRVQTAITDRGAGGGVVAVLLLDLDRFKEVNDTLGHHIGDELLQEVGARLVTTLRPQEMVARLGGDEFAILLPDVADVDAAEAFARTIRATLEQPFTMGPLTLVVGTSLGIAVSPAHGELATGLLQRADVAMYAAKADHRGVVVYAPEHDDHSPRRLSLVGDLRDAITNGRLEVHYQPKACSATGAIRGAEALVRWSHPTHGPIPPEEFMPIAERTGMIRELTTHVLRTALGHCRDWRRSGARIDVAVNLSVRSLLDPDFPAHVAALLDEAGVAAGSLTLELTESSIMADPHRSREVLRTLSGMGVQLAIDDFGTGYSSLSQLKQMPVDELKIDKSFILDMTSDDDDATIVRSTIELGHNLGLRLTAEGVEDAATWRALQALGCDVVQGYYLSRAVTAPLLVRWIAQWQEGVDDRRVPPFDDRAATFLVPDHPGWLT